MGLVGLEAEGFFFGWMAKLRQKLVDSVVFEQVFFYGEHAKGEKKTKTSPAHRSRVIGLL